MIIFIREETGARLVYLGETGNQARRLRELQLGNPSVLELLAVEPEPQGRLAKLQAQFATSNVTRRWYRPTPDLLAYIAAIPKATP